MFVFPRSLWTVMAGLGTALAVVALSLALEARPVRSASPVAVVQVPATAPAAQPWRAGDISFAKR
jgi:hypothetical protein